MSRDEDAARKFAVEWSTKGKGKIANLAGCYLRALEDVKAARAERDALAVALRTTCDEWENALGYKGDYLVKKHGDREELAAMRELIDETQCSDTCCGVRCRLPADHAGKHEWAPPTTTAADLAAKEER